MLTDAVRDLNILVVEDDKADARLIQRALADIPLLRIDVVRDGDDAIQSLTNGLPDLVLLDLMLPTVDGFEVLTWMKTQSMNVPTVVLSSANAEDVRARVYELGALTMVQKPTNRDEFQVFVRGLFDMWMRSLA